MQTYTVELPVDLDTFRFWFSDIFQISLWSTGLNTAAGVGNESDMGKRFAAYEERYFIDRNGMAVAYVHCRAFRRRHCMCRQHNIYLGRSLALNAKRFSKTTEPAGLSLFGLAADTSSRGHEGLVCFHVWTRPGARN